MACSLGPLLEKLLWTAEVRSLERRGPWRGEVLGGSEFRVFTCKYLGGKHGSLDADLLRRGSTRTSFSSILSQAAPRALTAGVAPGGDAGSVQASQPDRMCRGPLCSRELAPFTTTA